MIIKVIADPEILQDGGATSGIVSWTVSAAQSFLVGIPSLKRLLRIVTVTEGFTEHGYDLCMLKNDLETGEVIDVKRTPYEYELRSGSKIYVKKLKVSKLKVILTKEVVKCGELFDVLVNASDVRGNPRALPVGGRLRLLPKQISNSGSSNQTATLIGSVSQGTGDEKQVEFLFRNLKIEQSGEYLLRVEHITKEPPVAIDDGRDTRILKVKADPYPTISRLSLSHVGTYALQFEFNSNCEGLICFLIFNNKDHLEDSTSHFSVNDIREWSLKGIDLERQKGALITTDRLKDEGSGCGVLENCVSAGALRLRPGGQSAQVLLNLTLHKTYYIKAMADNIAGTNPGPDIFDWEIHVEEHDIVPPLLTNVVVESTAGGRGGIKLTFDSSNLGTLHYLVTEQNVYHPVTLSDIKTDMSLGSSLFIGSGSLPIGRGLDHSCFLNIKGIKPGVIYDLWWAAEAMESVPGIFKRGGEVGARPPKRIALVVPFEDPPNISSFSLIGVPDALRFRIHLETDCPGTVHFVVSKKESDAKFDGIGRFLNPSAVVAIAKSNDLTNEDPDIVAAGTCSAITAGKHTFIISYPIQRALVGQQVTREIEPNVPYEAFCVADNRTLDNHSSRVVSGGVVTLSPVDTTSNQFDDQLVSETIFEEDFNDAVVAETDDVSLRSESTVFDGAAIEKFPEQMWETDVAGLQSLFVHDGPLEHEMLPYAGAETIQQVFSAAQNTARTRAKDLRLQFVYLQQRVLDLETTLQVCRVEAAAARDDRHRFANRLEELLKQVEQRNAAKKQLESWKEEHLSLVREDILRETREVAAEVDLVKIGNQQWEERIGEAMELNDTLEKTYNGIAQRRNDYIKALQERCVKHSTQLKDVSERMEEVIELRKVKDEQELEIQKLKDRIAYYEPTQEEDYERTRSHRRVREVVEPEPEIVTRVLILPKGGLRVLMTIRGNGLQSMRFKHHVTAEIKTIDDLTNELHITGEATNVMAMVQEVEIIYEELKMEVTGPKRISLDL